MKLDHPDDGKTSDRVPTMKISPPELMRSLIGHVTNAAPGARAEVDEFPSGAAMLDVWCQGRFFNMAYFTSGHFGVDEVPEGEGFDMNYRYVFASFESAAAKELVQSAGSVPKRRRVENR